MRTILFLQNSNSDLAFIDQIEAIDRESWGHFVEVIL